MSTASAKPDRHTDRARDPKTWITDARRHLAVAELLRRRMNEIRVKAEEDQILLSGCFYSSLFHASIAIETAYKATLVASDPAIIEGGGIRKHAFPRGGHKLLEPVERILNVLSDDERYLLAKLEDYVEIGRYSVPRKADIFMDSERMNRARNAGLDEMGQVRRLVERLIEAVPRQAHHVNQLPPLAQ